MNKKLDIGLLLDSFEVFAWEFSMIERIVNSDYARIELIVVNMGPNLYKSTYDKFTRNRHKIIYALYNKFDEKLFRCTPNAFAKKDLQPLLPNTSRIEITPIQEKFFDYFSIEDINTIKTYNLDVLIRMGFRLLRGGILTASKYGIWSYHHGDNIVNRGGPPGFWEVVESWPETGSVLQILNEDLDNGNIIYRSWARTYQLSPVKNRNSYYWKSLSFLPRTLEELHRVGEEKFFARTSELNRKFNFYSYRLYKAPSNRKALILIIRQLSKIVLRALQKLLAVEQWSLMFNLSDDISVSLRKFKNIMPPKDRWWADPHVIFRNDTYYVFIEELLRKTMQGHISVIEINKKGNFNKPIKVLEKNYHLAYPFVFQWEENFYMIPESSENRTIELYECLEFPYKWNLKMNLMEGVFAVDTTLLYYRKRWWLFTNIVENEGAGYDDELFLFYSNDLLTTNWKNHPLNPIVSDVKRARPAGRIFQRDGKLYRPSQDCSTIYGYGFNVNEIVVLTETEYLEKTISTVKPNWEKHLEGTHTFTYETGLTIIDAFMRKPRLF